MLTNRLRLHGAIYCPDSFVLMLRSCANLKAIRYKSTSLNRIVADKSHRVIVALGSWSLKKSRSEMLLVSHCHCFYSREISQSENKIYSACRDLLLGSTGK